MEQALTTVSPDTQLIGLWLHGRSPHTQRAYSADSARLLAFTGRSLLQTTLSDLQAFADSLAGLQTSSRARILAAAKSLLAFGHKVGYLPFDVGVPLVLPKIKNTLAERILPEADIQRMIALEQQRRNHAILRLLYAGGLRVSELCGLMWRDLAPREMAGQVTVMGKGGKTRTILITAACWQAIAQLGDADVRDAPVFRSQKGGGLDTSAVLRIVRKAARRAGITLPVSPHWMRHAHASHALDRGAPAHLVQATLGHASLSTTSRYLHARPTDSSANYLAA